MQKDTIRDNRHAEIALAIKAAKKKMFKRSREGVNLREAADRFISDVAVSFADIVPDFPSGEYERPDDERENTIVVDLEAEQKKCYTKADVLLDFMDKPAGDFITDALVDAIAEAGEMVGFPTPSYAPEESKAERRKMLADLFSQDYRIKPRDFEQQVQRAVYLLLHNPKTPQGLFEAIAGFICEESNKADVFHSRSVLAELWKTIPPEELRGAIGGARQ